MSVIKFRSVFFTFAVLLCFSLFGCSTRDTGRVSDFIPKRQCLPVRSVDIICDDLSDSHLINKVCFFAHAEQWARERFLYGKKNGDFSCVIHIRVSVNKKVKNDGFFSDNISFYLLKMSVCLDLINSEGDRVGAFSISDSVSLDFKNLSEKFELIEVEDTIVVLLKRVNSRVDVEMPKLIKAMKRVK